LAINRKKKVELLEVYREQIQNSAAIVFTDYRGLSVSKIQSLRAKLGEVDARYMVVKNTLLSKAMAESGLPQPEELLSGTNAVAFVGEDVGRGVKTLTDWIKAEKMVTISGAVLGNSVLDGKNAEALADLPGKDQVRAMLLGAISAPASSLARLLNAPSGSLARVINAHVEKQPDAEAA
jgi:large subunit ribosomal protein L10